MTLLSLFLRKLQQTNMAWTTKMDTCWTGSETIFEKDGLQY